MPGGRIREKCTTELTDYALCVGKWMGCRNAELNGRILQHGGIFLEHLSVQNRGELSKVCG